MSHDQTLDKLIRMANQIATFFLSQPADVRVEGVATHINKFWEPRMRQQFFEHVDGGGEGLLPLVLEAAPLIKRPKEKDGVGVGFETSAAASQGKGPAAGESLSEPSIPE